MLILFNLIPNIKKMVYTKENCEQYLNKYIFIEYWYKRRHYESDKWHMVKIPKFIYGTIKELTEDELIVDINNENIPHPLKYSQIKLIKFCNLNNND